MRGDGFLLTWSLLYDKWVGTEGMMLANNMKQRERSERAAFVECRAIRGLISDEEHET